MASLFSPKVDGEKRALWNELQRGLFIFFQDFVCKTLSNEAAGQQKAEDALKRARRILYTWNIIIQNAVLTTVLSLCDKEEVFSELANRNIRLPSIGKPGVRFWILQSNAKFVFGFHLREIRPQGRFQFRNPNPDFMDFLLTVRLGNPKKDLQNCSRQERSFFAYYACACKTAVLKDSQFQSLFGFPNRTVERKSKNRFLSVEIRFWISRSIANPKSGF